MFVSYTQLNPVIEGSKFDVINLESFFLAVLDPDPCYKKMCTHFCYISRCKMLHDFPDKQTRHCASGGQISLFVGLKPVSN